MKSLATVCCALFMVSALLAFTGGAMAQPGVGPSAPMATSYDLSWWSADGGGYTFSSDGEYELGGTIAQPDAWSGRTVGGYDLSTGFWSCGPPRYYTYFALGLKRY
jgi:hypothetical protein